MLDHVRERRPPFSPASVVEEFAGGLKAYGITTVTGDRYAGEWPPEAFAQQNVQYLVAEQAKSDLYREALPLIHNKQVELLDNLRLISQLCALERRTARGGRDSIDHPPGAHDDLVNAALGALLLAARVQDYSDIEIPILERPSPWSPWVDEPRRPSWWSR